MINKTLAKSYKQMPGNARITFPPIVRFFSDIKEGDYLKIWITDDQIIHIQKLTENNSHFENKSSVSVDSIVELLNSMSSDDKIRVIQGIAPPCFKY